MSERDDLLDNQNNENKTHMANLVKSNSYLAEVVKTLNALLRGLPPGVNPDTKKTENVPEPKTSVDEKDIKKDAEDVAKSLTEADKNLQNKKKEMKRTEKSKKNKVKKDAKDVKKEIKQLNKNVNREEKMDQEQSLVNRELISSWQTEIGHLSQIHNERDPEKFIYEIQKIRPKLEKLKDTLKTIGIGVKRFKYRMRKYELKEVEKIVEDIKTLKLEDNEHLQAIQKINSQIEYIRKEWEQLQLDEQRMLYVSNKFKTESTKYGELLNLLPKANAKLPTESGKKTKDNKMDEWQSHIANLILIHKTLLDEMNQYERAINATLEVEVILKKEIKKANEVIKEYIDLIDMGNNMANNSGSI